MEAEEKRLDKLRRRLCPRCPINGTCAQFPEQLEACADAARLIRAETLAPGRDLLRERLDLERRQVEKEGTDGDD